MKKRYIYVLLIFAVITLLSGFTSENDFPAPIKEPAAAVYINLSSSGIYDEENQSACEEIAKNVANICKLRNSTNDSSLTENDYKKLTLDFLEESIINGFLKIQEIYFYYKTPEEYAFIAKGEFDLNTIAEKSKAEMIFDEEERLAKISTSINSNAEKEKILLQATRDTLIISPEKAISEITKNIETNTNLLGTKFNTFKKMIKNHPVISAEMDLQEIFKGNDTQKLPKSVTATDIIRLFISPKQNKIQMNIPEEDDREEIKTEIENNTSVLNSFFDNKTDYRIREGVTSIFIESEPDEEQVLTISQKATAFMLHFFVKNISSSQP